MKITLLLNKILLKSSTGGVWNSNGVAQCAFLYCFIPVPTPRHDICFILNVTTRVFSQCLKIMVLTIMNIDYNLNCLAGTDQLSIPFIFVKHWALWEKNMIHVFYRVNGTKWYPKRKKKIKTKKLRNNCSFMKKTPDKIVQPSMERFHVFLSFIMCRKEPWEGMIFCRGYLHAFIAISSKKQFYSQHHILLSAVSKDIFNTIYCCQQ